MDRRRFLVAAGAGGFALACPGLALARTAGDSRLVVVILRGALDGLAAVPAVGDPNYRRQRGALAIDAPGTAGGALALDADFALHPALTGLHGRYQQQELLVFHAAATPYRERSHFDGQDWLEAGAAHARDGWLNRSLASLPNAVSGERGIALGSTMPLALRGAAPVTTWAPSRMPDADADTLNRIGLLYAEDPLLAQRFSEALAAAEIAGTMGGVGPAFGARAFEQLARAAGRFLAAPEGPRVAVLESGGWDTHANQGASSGALANRFRALDDGLANLQRELGSAWDRTAVAIVTEFGRTVHVNGTRGTDHGTATAAILLGGAVNGGKVITDWPGLADRDLYARRDLMPTTDIRSVFKGLLEEHLRVPQATVEQEVFPGSNSAKPLRNLVNA